MSLWLLLVIGVVLGIALLAVGVHMVRPSWSEKGTRADVGVAVITTTVISLAIFVLQILDENRLQRSDEIRQEQAANQALRLQLGLSSKLTFMDLNGQDLRGINLPFKNLAGAKFKRADLSGANLREANLEGANFERARLADASLYRADLSGGAVLDDADATNADFTGANLEGAKLVNANLGAAMLYGADLTDADVSGANLKGAVVQLPKGLAYDDHTVFPNGRTLPCSPKQAPCILTLKKIQALKRPR